MKGERDEREGEEERAKKKEKERSEVAESFQRFLRSVVKAYLQRLHTNPMHTKALAW
jgi:hypothetical protein